MRTLLTKIFPVVIFAGLLTNAVVHERDWNSLRRAMLRGDNDAPGTRDNPTARAEFEAMRLRSPKTGKILERSAELAFARTLPVKGWNGKNTLLQTADWMARGPYTLGGRTRAFGIDVTNTNVLIAGAISGGIWKSTDGGQTWLKKTKPTDLQSVSCLAQDIRPGRTQNWYYGTGELRGNSASNGGEYLGDGIYRSTDGGETWRVLPATASNTPGTIEPFDYVHAIIVDPTATDKDVVVAATGKGILRSSDGGISWKSVLGNFFGSTIYSFVEVDANGVMYATLGSAAADASGIWRSDDHGVTWTDISPAFMPNSFNKIVPAIAPSNTNIVYFAAHTPGSGQNSTSLYRYEYLGGDGTNGMWQDLSANLPSSIENYYSYCLTVGVKPDDEETVFVAGLNLYRSTDGFRTSEQVQTIGGSYPYPSHADMHVLLFDPNDPSRLYTANDGGVQVTPDCNANFVEWNSLNAGYVSSQFYSVAIDGKTPGSGLVTGGAQDNGSWVTADLDPMAPWGSINGSDGAYSFVIDDHNLVASTQNGNMYKVTVSDDFEPKMYTRLDPRNGSGYYFINPLAFDPVDHDIMYIPTSTGLWRNKKISAISEGQSPPSTGWLKLGKASANGSLFAVAAATTPRGLLYFANTTGHLFRVDDAITPTNPDVVEITGTNFPEGFLNCISIDPEDGSHVLVCFSNYDVLSIFETHDKGATWREVSGNLEANADGSGPGPSVRWVNMLHYQTGTKYFAATSAGLYSTDQLEGRNTVWEQEAPQTIGNVVVDMIDIRQSDNFIAIATHGNGIYSAFYPTVSKKVEAGQAASGELSVYPNPIHGESNSVQATISFGLPSSSFVTAAVYDNLGRKLEQLIAARLPAGNQTVQWSSKNLPAGTYWIELQRQSAAIIRQKVMVAP